MDIAAYFSDNKRIVIANKVLSTRRVIARLLEMLGIENYLDAESGVEALNLINRGGVGLVISEWNMPELNGMELLKKLQENSEQKNIPFLMITSNMKEKEQLKNLGAGSTESITKPFGKNILKEKIEILLKSVEVKA